jgi:cyclic pyranopterin monophosphate synthase
MDNFSHLNQQGKASMVDVSDKPDQNRQAEAKGRIILQPDTLQKVKENDLKKGDVLSVARIAGIQAAKATSTLIPLCHNLLLSQVTVDFNYTDTGIEVSCIAKCTGPTGVEMEALTGASVALLTIYDMCKAIDKTIVIAEIRLISKTKV